jgi:hypothetical protein
MKNYTIVKRDPLFLCTVCGTSYEFKDQAIKCSTAEPLPPCKFNIGDTIFWEEPSSTRIVAAGINKIVRINQIKSKNINPLHNGHKYSIDTLPFKGIAEEYILPVNDLIIYKHNCKHTVLYDRLINKEFTDTKFTIYEILTPLGYDVFNLDILGHEMWVGREFDFQRWGNKELVFTIIKNSIPKKSITIEELEQSLQIESSFQEGELEIIHMG